MIENLQEIKRMRKNLGINQKDLAAQAGVSQSLIAKIESGKLDPTFTKAKQIFRALEELQEKEEIKAKEIMNKKVVFVKANDKVKEIIAIMKRKGISQVPVLKNEKVCGLITEGTILKKLVQNPEKINYLRAEEIMEDAPPIVSPKTNLKILLELLKESQLILVAEKGETKGIISKTDLLDRI
ncbi:MAG: CBS domain-containing protein [Nanoarchaeota archaeon]|nr:CBS domain-containing protein [Nanoarchaeota archaeon]MBU1974622.1 CBS domain-containing protein [Nanoarchaeota archaeon]